MCIAESRQMNDLRYSMLACMNDPEILTLLSSRRVAARPRFWELL